MNKPLTEERAAKIAALREAAKAKYEQTAPQTLEEAFGETAVDVETFIAQNDLEGNV